MGNLKQLQTGWLVDATDHDDFMPPNQWDGVKPIRRVRLPGSGGWPQRRL